MRDEIVCPIRSISRWLVSSDSFAELNLADPDADDTVLTKSLLWPPSKAASVAPQQNFLQRYPFAIRGVTL